MSLYSQTLMRMHQQRKIEESKSHKAKKISRLLTDGCLKIKNDYKLVSPALKDDIDILIKLSQDLNTLCNENDLFMDENLTPRTPRKETVEENLNLTPRSKKIEELKLKRLKSKSVLVQ
jgi:uncharacterized protein with gpF-like domain